MQIYDAHQVNVSLLDAVMLCSTQPTQPYMMVLASSHVQMQECLRENIGAQ